MMLKATSILFAAALAAGPALAQDAAVPPAAAASGNVGFATPDNDRSNFLGDRIFYRYDTHVYRVDMTDPTRPTSSACLPANTSLKGIGTVEVSTEMDGTNGPERLKKIAFVVKTGAEAASRGPAAPAAAPVQARCTAGNAVREGDVVLLDLEQLTTLAVSRFGLTYGTLLVPYKYHFKGDREFTGAATIGGYVGYREASSGLAMQYIVFAGASSVPVTGQDAEGAVTTQSLTGFSYGIGLLGTVKDSFQMGLVVGADRVGAGAGYVNNGKAWVAVSLGYAFSN